MLPSLPPHSRRSTSNPPAPSPRQANPFLIDLVLEVLFKYCPKTFAFVKDARLVCKAWKEAIEKQWISLTVPITIVQNEHAPQQQSTSNKTEETEITLSQFLQQQTSGGKNKAKIYYRNVVLKNWKISRKDFIIGNGREAEVNQRFWALYGKNIHVVTLKECELDFITETRTNGRMFGALSNVERLTIKDCKFALPRLDPLQPRRGREDVDPARVFFHFLKNTGPQQHHTVEYSRCVECDLIRRDYEVQRMQNQGVFVEACPPFIRVRRRRRQGIENENENEGQFPVAQVARWERIPSMEYRYRTRGSRRPPRLQLAELKYICFENVKFVDRERRLPWNELFSVCSNLEEISFRCAPCLVSQLSSSLCKDDYVSEKLSKIDVMNSTKTAAEYCCWSMIDSRWRPLSLKKLTLDCGFGTNLIEIEMLLETHSKSLENVQLYRAPFSKPFNSFPCNAKMPNLTELHLWGNITDNLNFLLVTPKLKVLKWNAFCYTEGNHAARLHEYLKPNQCSFRREKMLPIFTKNVVENTNKLRYNFKLKSMTTLEIEWGQTSIEAWIYLGDWMPNLKELKGVVTGDKQLALILYKWPDIRSIEIAHGSNVSADKIRNVARSFESKGLKLWNFIWKPCSCLRLSADDKLCEILADNELRKRVTNKLVLPWITLRFLEREGLGDIPCLQNLFEKAIVTGEQYVPAFLEALRHVKPRNR